MSFNLIDAARGLLPNDLLSKAAGSLGESENGIQKALSGAIPSVLAGLLGQSSGSGAGGILDMVKNAAGGGILNNIGGLIGGGGASSGGIGATVMGWLRSLFGDKLNSIINAIAGFAGIKTSSASNVLSLAAPAVLGSVGQYAKENNLSASGLSSFLQSQKSSILDAIPSGFNLAGALGLSSLGDIGGKISGVLSTASENVRRSSKGWLWLIILLVAALLIWLLTSKGCKHEEAVTPATTTDTPVATTPTTTVTPVPTVKGRLDTISGNFIYDLGETIMLSLPNKGGELKVGKWSTEARLVDFLTNTSATIDTVKGNWFDFTDVRFKTGGTTLTPESFTQLKNLVTIIKAFPDARFKIGGYTDNTGDPARNRELSQKRAEAVAAEIIKLGASASQLTKAEGYGDQYPVGDNSTPEGRAMNRRVSVNVKAK